MHDIKDKLAIYLEYYIKSQNIYRNLTLKNSVDYISTKRVDLTNCNLLILFF